MSKGQQRSRKIWFFSAKLYWKQNTPHDTTHHHSSSNTYCRTGWCLDSLLDRRRVEKSKKRNKKMLKGDWYWKNAATQYFTTFPRSSATSWSVTIAVRKKAFFWFGKGSFWTSFDHNFHLSLRRKFQLVSMGRRKLAELLGVINFTNWLFYC